MTELSNFQMPGCAARLNAQHTVNLTLPRTELGNQTKLCGSINTANFKVSYDLRCLVKHGGMCERGQGNVVSIPITLVEGYVPLLPPGMQYN